MDVDDVLAGDHTMPAALASADAQLCVALKTFSDVVRWHLTSSCQILTGNKLQRPVSRRPFLTS